MYDSYNVDRPSKAGLLRAVLAREAAFGALEKLPGRPHLWLRLRYHEALAHEHEAVAQECMAVRVHAQISRG